MKGMNREFSELSNRVVGCAIEMHRLVGPGLLESTYHQRLAHKLKLNGIGFTLEHPLPVEYKGLQLDCGYPINVLYKNPKGGFHWLGD